MEKLNFLSEFSRRIDGFYQKGILPAYFKSPIFCLWEVTDKCNLSCVHCFYNANSKKAAELTTDEALNVIGQLSALGVFEVYLIGGEPLLRDDWRVLVKSLRDHRMQVGIISNGTLIDRETARDLARLKVKWVQVSIDGASASTHDAVRGIPGAWDKSVNAIRFLKAENIRTYVSFVPTKINFRDVKNAVGLCVDMGLDYFLTDMLVLTGRAALNYDKIGLDARGYSEFFELLEDAAKTYGDKITINAPTKEKETLQVYVKSRAAIPNFWCIINPRGACRLDILVPYTYGDLRTQSLKSIWDNFLKFGWKRPEVVQFIESLRLMSDLAKAAQLPYVSEDVHYG
jgi:AdoMet-dependent heme synthase